VLRLSDVAEPVVGDDDVLVRVHAASVNPADRYLLRGRPYAMRLLTGLRRPTSKRLGQDIAGEVAAVGKNVTTLKLGDEVFGAIRDAFNRNIDRAFGEYALATADLLVRKPPGITFESAAASPMAGLTALQGLRDRGGVRQGQKVLITGASGGIGTFAVQIAKSFGAEVTGVCSTPNLELVRAIGADHVIDYMREDYLAGGPRFDLMLDVAATRTPSQCSRILTPGGAYVFVGTPKGGRWLGPLGVVLGVKTASWFIRGKRIFIVAESPNQADLVTLRELLEAGKVKPVLDRTYPLSQVPAAVAYVEQGHARGKVVITN